MPIRKYLIFRLNDKMFMDKTIFRQTIWRKKGNDSFEGGGGGLHILNEDRA